MSLVRTLVSASLFIATFSSPPAADAAETPPPQQDARVSYVHDETGRLATAVDPSGAQARYAYDEVGNVTSIARVPAAAVVVADFTPRHARPGEEIVVVGHGFSATPGGNEVEIGGAEADVVDASPTAIRVVVPDDVSTGTVSVTSPAGTATSDGEFTLDTVDTPIIDSFAPVVVATGGEVVVSGENFLTGELEMMAAIGSTRVVSDQADEDEVTLEVPRTGSGHISLATSYGVAETTEDLYVAPEGVAPSDVAPRGRLTPDEPVTITITARDDVAMYLFDAEAGDRITIDVTDSTIAYSYLSVIAPDGSAVLNQEGVGSSRYFDAISLPTNGTYALVVDPDDIATGSMSVLVAEVPADATTTLDVDGPQQKLRTTTPGQNAVFTFAGTTGQRVAATLNPAATYDAMSVVAPNGEILWESTCCGGNRFTDALTLPTAGTYSIIADLYDTDIGVVSARLWSVPADATATAVVDGPRVSTTTTTAGQNAVISFAGTAGQYVAATLDPTSRSDATSVHAPNGDELWSSSCCTGNRFTDALRLPVNGTYTIVFDVFDTHVGTVAAQIHRVVDVTGTAVVDGPRVSLTTTTTGQNAIFSFAGTAGQRVAAMLEPATRTDITSVRRPNGEVLWTASCCKGSRFTDALKLPVTGTYTIVFDLAGTHVGTVSAQVYSVVDATTAVTVDGPQRSLTTTIAGQNAVFSFAGTAGQRIAATLDPAFKADVTSVRKPNGDELWSATCCGRERFTDALKLPVTGTYTIVFDLPGTHVGTVSTKVYSVVDATTALTADGPQKSLTTTIAGQNAVFTFVGAARQDISATLDPAFRTDITSVLRPNGEVLWTADCCQHNRSTGTIRLPVAGTYTIVFDLAGTHVGTVAAQLFTEGAVDGETVDESEPTDLPADVPTDAPTDVPADVPTDRGIVEDRGAVITAPTVDAPSDEVTVALPLPTWWRPLPPVDTEDQTHTVDAERDPSPWADLPPRRARRGHTALAGQVLRQDGLPLSGVVVEVEEQRAVTDESGRFLLTDVEPGPAEVVLDARPASRSTGPSYGLFEVGQTLTEGATTVLPYTVWMPELDTENTVDVPDVIEEEIVVTTPDIPGLEVHIPPGSRIVDHDGQPVHELGITAIPTDKPPFPLPPFGVFVPIYFTLQPGGAYVEPPAAQIVYPNFTHKLPGERVDFWLYDPEEGWHVYGHGTVTADGTQVVPDADTTIYEFLGAMMNGGNYPPDGAPPPGEGGEDGDPVNLSTGLFVNESTDIVLPDVLPLSLSRTYRQSDTRSRAFGIGSTDPYDMFLWSAQQYQEVDLILPDGGRVHYDRTSPGESYSDAVFTAAPTPTEFQGSTVRQDNGHWLLTLTNGTVYDFPWYTPLTAIRDRFGNEVRIDRGSDNEILRVISPNGRWIDFGYDAGLRITDATDNGRRNWHYTYDDSGHLTEVRDPELHTTKYTYDTSSRMLSITDAREITYLTNTYDSRSRVEEQTLADGGTYHFAYTADAQGDISETVVTDPRGTVRATSFNDDGYTIRDVAARGSRDEQITTIERAPGTNLATEMVDPLGRRTTYAYDARGNPTVVTENVGTPDEARTRMSYTTWNDLASLTDPLNHKSTFVYNTRGALVETRNALDETTTITTLRSGQPKSMTDPMGHTTTFDYFLGDPVKVTDALGRITTSVYDTVGRRINQTDALGNRTRYLFDALGVAEGTVDARGVLTSVDHDENGNLVELTDGRGNETRYTINAMDWTSERVDPLGATDTYDYDSLGNLTTATDRRGIDSIYTYDALNRVKTAKNGTEPKTTYDYDAAGRLLTASSSDGTLEWEYDGQDNVTSETTAQGTVTYSFDKASRRTTMTVPGQSPTTYKYDAADRVTEISRDAQKVTFDYDASGRLLTRTQPNGVAVSYVWDDGSQLSQIEYKRGDTTLGDLRYYYDDAGHRSAVGGSLATIALPDALTAATYDDANRLTEWGSTALSYDAAGNLTDDGDSTYVWNDRNQLTSITGGETAAFSYDDLGRRTDLTIGGASTQFTYDGENIARETTGSAAVDYLNGLNLDERYSRTDAGGTKSFLVDALGSTVGLVNGGGSLATQYTYEPYGVTSRTGSSSSNRFQFTGRENDGGLYFNRSRYYNPEYGRFISEDPIGFDGGSPNLYSYAAGDPTTFTDRTGQFLDTLLDLGFVAYDLYRLATDGRKNFGENLAALGLDLGGTVLPFVTGLGAASRAARGASHAADAGRLEIQLGTKIEGQLGKRGWTPDSVQDLIDNPSRTVATRDTRHLPGGGQNDAPATAYINESGGYVVRNDETGDIVQVSDLNDPNWKSPW